MCFKTCYNKTYRHQSWAELSWPEGRVSSTAGQIDMSTRQYTYDVYSILMQAIALDASLFWSGKRK